VKQAPGRNRSRQSAMTQGRTQGRTQAHQRGRTARRKPRSLWSCWPVLLGCVLAPLAVRTVDILTLTGPWAARLLMPWSFLLQGHALHLPDGWADSLNACVLWLQFPVYGLAFMLLWRRLHFGTALAVTAAFHFLAFFIVAVVALS